MKILRFDDDRIGVLVEGDVVDISGLIAHRELRGPQGAMEELIGGFASYKDKIAAILPTAPRRKLSEVRLLPPLPRPGVVLAAFSNFLDRPGRKKEEVVIDFFHKSPNLVGPGGTIELPDIEAVSVYHAEAELAFVIGAPGAKISAANWRDHVFGYVPFFDISARGLTRRSLLIPKGMDTFSACGPWITTADEIADPHNLTVKSWISGELRQNYSTGLMAHQIPDQIAWLSRFVRLAPGDLIATGVHHEGLSPINSGDDVKIEIEGLGPASFKVVGDAPKKNAPWPEPGQGGRGAKVSIV